jgi:helix-turn-helix protein
MELLSLPEVARSLGVTLDEALALVETKKLPAGRGPDGGVYVRATALDEYQRANASA